MGEKGVIGDASNQLAETSTSYSVWIKTPVHIWLMYKPYLFSVCRFNVSVSTQIYSNHLKKHTCLGIDRLLRLVLILGSWHKVLPVS